MSVPFSMFNCKHCGRLVVASANADKVCGNPTCFSKERKATDKPLPYRPKGKKSKKAVKAKTSHKPVMLASHSLMDWPVSVLRWALDNREEF